MRGNRILSALAGIVVLFELTDLVVRDTLESSGYLQLALWMLIWIVPISIWLFFARGSEDRRNRVRMGAMVFYVPIFLLGLAFLPVHTYVARGFGSFVVGMLLVWWGLLQSGEKMRNAVSPGGSAPTG
jgi:hypothetical protein